MHLAVVHGYDVIVLDVMLPGADGFVVCRGSREEARRDTPILMLTARDTLEDKITGLEAGAGRLPREALRDPRTGGALADACAAGADAPRARLTASAT